MRQRRHAHGHALGLLGLGRAGGGEADADHLVDGSKEPKLGLALEIPESDGGGGGEKRVRHTKKTSLSSLLSL